MRKVRHKKRGSTYDVLGEADMQISTPGTDIYSKLSIADDKTRAIRDGDKIVVYRCIETGQLWVRPSDEFNDGRFEEIP